MPIKKNIPKNGFPVQFPDFQVQFKAEKAYVWTLDQCEDCMATFYSR